MVDETKQKRLNFALYAWFCTGRDLWDLDQDEIWHLDRLYNAGSHWMYYRPLITKGKDTYDS